MTMSLENDGEKVSVNFVILRSMMKNVFFRNKLECSSLEIIYTLT
jgi:hypothetical protein